MIISETFDKEIQPSHKSKGADSKGKIIVENLESSDEDVEKLEDDASSSEDDRNSNDGRTRETANPGWADVMQKILKANKPKRKKTIVLSKAKKLTTVRNEETPKDSSFDINPKSEDSKLEILPKHETAELKKDVEAVKKRRKNLPTAIRVKPSFHDRERERLLQKIATKGVVQLFNVVKQQQTEIEEKITAAGPLERKREKVLSNIDKRAFLDVLMGGSKSISVDDEAKSRGIEKKEDNEPDKVWSVLRDEFTMGAKLKDWDKKAPENDDDSTSSEEMDSD